MKTVSLCPQTLQVKRLQRRLEVHLRHHANSFGFSSLPPFPLCGEFFLFFVSTLFFFFCSSSLHHRQVDSLCGCGRPGKWTVDTSCQAKESNSSSSFFLFFFSLLCLQTWTESRKKKDEDTFGKLTRWHRMSGLANDGLWMNGAFCACNLIFIPL